MVGKNIDEKHRILFTTKMGINSTVALNVPQFDEQIVPLLKQALQAEKLQNGIIAFAQVGKCEWFDPNNVEHVLHDTFTGPYE